MLKPLAPCGFLCTCYSFIIRVVISFVNIDKSHFISTNYSFATLFDADRQKAKKCTVVFYAHLINAQKRAAYHLGYDLRHYYAQHHAFIKQFSLPAHFQFDVAAG